MGLVSYFMGLWVILNYVISENDAQLHCLSNGVSSISPVLTQPNM